MAQRFCISLHFLGLRTTETGSSKIRRPRYYCSVPGCSCGVCAHGRVPYICFGSDSKQGSAISNRHILPYKWDRNSLRGGDLGEEETLDERGFSLVIRNQHCHVDGERDEYSQWAFHDSLERSM